MSSKNPQGPIETEVKIRMGEGAAEARGRIEARGFRLSVARTLQVDQMFDFPDLALRQSGRLLRVRAEGAESAGILTFKGPADRSAVHKSREELETSAADRAVLERILSRLGFVPTFRYEKFRTTFREPSGAAQESGLIALDETPIGVFLELEGPAYWIDATASYLGFAPADYVTKSYAALYRDYLRNNPGPTDMIFLSGVVRAPGKDS